MKILQTFQFGFHEIRGFLSKCYLGSTENYGDGSVGGVHLCCCYLGVYLGLVGEKIKVRVRVMVTEVSFVILSGPRR